MKASLDSVFDQIDAVQHQYDRLLAQVEYQLPEVHAHLDTAREEVLASLAVLAVLVDTCYGGAFGTLQSTAGRFFGVRAAGASYGLAHRLEHLQCRRTLADLESHR